MINWREKLSSRKFWALVASFIASLLFLFGFSEGTIESITALLTSFGAVIVYLLVEGSIDKEKAKGVKGGQ